MKKTSGVDSQFDPSAIHVGLPPIRSRGNVLRPGCSGARGSPAALAVVGATRLAEGSVRARGEVETHTSPPALHGSLPHQRSLAGRPVKRRFEALDHNTRHPLGRRSGGRLRPGSTP